MILRKFGIPAAQLRRAFSAFVNDVRLYERYKKDDSLLVDQFPNGKFILFCDNQPLLRARSNALRSNALAFLSHDDLKSTEKVLERSLCSPEKSAFIDVIQRTNGSSATIFAVGCSLKGDLESKNKISNIETNLDGAFSDLRRAVFTVHAQEKHGSYLTKANTLLKWINNFRHCPKCCSELNFNVSKSAARCEKCRKKFYPQISTSAVVVVTDKEQDQILLVQPLRAPRGLFTAVSGFLDVGESLEENVRREVAEEVGVEVTGVQYAGGSQPWPFPDGTIMCAFYAEADPSMGLNIDPVEIADAGWFNRAEVSEAYENTLKMMEIKHYDINKEPPKRFCLIPPKGTIPHDLIKNWLLL